METGIMVTVLIFLAGVIYHAGRLSSRVDAIDEWRRTTADTIGKIGSVVDRIDAVLKHEEGR